jgi:hypothetical protein
MKGSPHGGVMTAFSLERYTRSGDYSGNWRCECCGLDEDYLTALNSLDGMYRLCDSCLRDLYESLRERFAAVAVIACRCPAEYERGDVATCWKNCRPHYNPTSWGSPPCAFNCNCLEATGSKECCEQVLAY